MGQLFEDVEKIHVYAGGTLDVLSVCAPKEMPRERLVAAVNAGHPTGIESQWTVSEEDFRGGEPNPCPCNDEPDDRLHYLMHC